ncbi:hypothetical protein CDL15_Pgr024956 [Punica granatum]|nr:hypothetical protein CDL15_Pgr024956 [Punica granatum]
MEGQLERNGAERAIGTVMTDEKGQVMRQNALALKRDLEASISEGGFTSVSVRELVRLISSFCSC